MTGASPETRGPRFSGRHVTADAGDRIAAIAILAPAGRDGTVAGMILSQAGFATRVCTDMVSLCIAVEEDVGALLLAEEALASTARDELLAVLEAQPSWSDIPVVVLTGEGELSRSLSPTLNLLATRANVTLLERPVRVATLVTAMRSALRARRRQFDVRDHLAERTEAEAALRGARQEAENASRAKGEFLAVMSHELRTPLNAIGGYAELMEMGLRGPITDQQRADLARIQQSQKHLLGLINQVLNYTRIETGTVRYELGDVAVAEALAAAEALVVPQVRAKGLAYSFGTCDPSLTLRADRDKLQQILLNLLSNAIKFGRGKPVRVAWRPLPEGGVRVAVIDQGAGIAREDIPRIFDEFVQLQEHQGSGTGLGLPISSRLAEALGG